MLLVATLMAHLVLWLTEVNCTVLMYYLMCLWLSVTSLLQMETVKMMWQMFLQKIEMFLLLLLTVPTLIWQSQKF
jgi:hypothetical protein